MRSTRQTHTRLGTMDGIGLLLACGFDHSGPEEEQEAAVVVNGARQGAGVAPHHPLVPSPSALILFR
jgi:hypothetical protein